MTAEQRTIYELSLIQYRDMKSAIDTAVEEALEEKEIKVILGLFENGVSIPIIAKSLKITEKKVEYVITTYQ